MGYRAIALSQVDGAGGEVIGRNLAHKLGFGYLNEAIVAQVAKDHGVDQAVVVGAERRKSFFTRVAEMETAKSLRQSDAARASYLKRVYGVGQEAPTDYDVVLNTERLAPDAASDLILGLIQARPAAPPPTTARASGG